MKIVFYITIFATFFIGCKPSAYTIAEKSGTITVIKSQDSVHWQIESIISPYREQLNQKMDVIINESTQFMTVGSPQGLLGNFVTDLCLKLITDSLKLDSGYLNMALLNNGGLRTGLPEGEITVRKIFEIMPFENQLVIVEIDGVNFRKAIQTIASKCESYENTKGCIPFSGIEITVKKSSDEILVNNNSIDTSLTYRILTSDYLASGGDNMHFFSSAVSVVNTHIKLRDAIIYYIEKEFRLGNKITANTDNRIRYVE